MEKAIISIVMPVYNVDKYLKEAIESILDQTFKNFELIIINDASTDNTLNIIKSFDDQRIVIINNEKNLGVTRSLNIGIRQARGKYIARMDADDISLPERLEKQYNFLEKNKNIGVLGTWMYVINKNGKITGMLKKATEHYLIKWKCFIGFPMIHPSIMAQAHILKENPYNENYRTAQDTELWSRLIFEKNIKFANLNEYLLKYRVHDNSTTRFRSPEKKLQSQLILIYNIKKYFNFDYEEIEKIKSIRTGKNSFRNLYENNKFNFDLLLKYIKKERLNREQAEFIKFSYKKKSIYALFKIYLKTKLNVFRNKQFKK